MQASVQENVMAEIDMSLAVPRNLSTTKSDLAKRKVFISERWYCVSRPQYPKSCGMTSLVSVWNYLYSKLGHGTLPPLSQEEAMTLVGMQPPFETIKWGPFTGNTTLMRWFHVINKAKGVTGKAHYFFKAHGHGRTIGLEPEVALGMLKDGLASDKIGYVYHCYNHYMVPLGFEVQPAAPSLAYSPSLTPLEESHTHIIIGEVSRGHQPFHVRKWEEIVTDLTTQLPSYYNIRHPEKGIMKKEKCKRVGGNIHCIMAFRSDVAEEVNFSEDQGDQEEDEDENEEAFFPIPNRPRSPH